MTTTDLRTLSAALQARAFDTERERLERAADVLERWAARAEPADRHEALMIATDLRDVARRVCP